MALSKLFIAVENNDPTYFASTEDARYTFVKNIVSTISSIQKRRQLNLYDYKDFNEYDISESDIVQFMIDKIENKTTLDKDKAALFEKYRQANTDKDSKYTNFKNAVNYNQHIYKDNPEIRDFTSFFAIEAIEESILYKCHHHKKFQLGLITKDEYHAELKKFLQHYKLYCDEREKAGIWNAKGLAGIITKIKQKASKVTKKLSDKLGFSSDSEEEETNEVKLFFKKLLPVIAKVITHRSTGRVISIIGMIITVILASFTPAGPVVPLIFFAIFLAFIAISIGFEAYSRYKVRQLKKENALLKQYEQLEQKSQDLNKDLADKKILDKTNYETFQGKSARGAENLKLPNIRPQGASLYQTIRTAYGENITLLVLNTGLVLSQAPNIIGLVTSSLSLLLDINSRLIEQDFTNMYKDNLKWRNTDLKIGTPTYKNLSELESLVAEKEKYNNAKQVVLNSNGLTIEVALASQTNYIPKPKASRIWENFKSYLKEYVDAMNPFATPMGEIYEEDLLSQSNAAVKTEYSTERVKGKEVIIVSPTKNVDNPQTPEQENGRSP